MFRVRIRSPQDLGAGAVFVLIGVAGFFFARDLAFGSASRMGPGYFPSIVSALIFALGLGLGARSLAVEGPRVEPMRLRPIAFVVGAVLAFGVLLDLVGLAATTFALTVAVSYARREVKLLETVLLGAGLALFVVGLFVYALSQPLPAWWGAP